jgi:BNR repeat-like domain
VPCWNPVLFWMDGAGPGGGGQVWLFYKCGHSPRSWRGAYRTSADGIDWSPAVRLPPEILGPIKDKPIRLANGDILAGTSVETALAWTCWIDRSTDLGRTWQRYGPITMPGFHHGIIQPTLWEVHPGEVRMLVRSSHDIGRICESTSGDGGRTWSAPQPTELPNPNSGIDAVKLRDGVVALVYNPSTSERTPLAISFSRDEGATWSPPRTIEAGPGEYSYPAIIQTRDGLLHITYTWQRRRIRHVVIDPRALGF